MTLYRVKDKDKNYEYIKKEDGNSVINWFEKFDLTQINKIKLDPNCFSSADKIGDIMKNPEGEKSFQNILEKWWSTRNLA
ncbi:MAG: hypothetical protein ACLRMN_04405 [Mediterraneibacter gnavus]